MERRGTRWALGGWTALVVLFLWAPLALIMVYAFNKSNVQSWPIPGFTTHWFHVAWQASEVRNAQPDPYVWYHLALALDHQKKYPEALIAVNSALKFVGPNADLEKLALGERDRLSKLAGPAAATAPAKVPK